MTNGTEDNGVFGLTLRFITRCCEDIPERHPTYLQHSLTKPSGSASRHLAPNGQQYLSVLPTSGRKEMFYLTTHSTHFMYGYMASDIWVRTILIVRKETRCHQLRYSLQLTPSHRQDNTYHGLCYTSIEALAGTRNSSTHHTMSERSTSELHPAPFFFGN